MYFLISQSAFSSIGIGSGFTNEKCDPPNINNAIVGRNDIEHAFKMGNGAYGKLLGYDKKDKFALGHLATMILNFLQIKVFRGIFFLTFLRN